jgi:membrane fusion protein (multidrug efflux system)
MACASARNRTLSVLAAGLCGLLSACDQQSRGSESHAPPPVAVQIVRADPAPLPQTLTGVGSLRSPQRATIATEIAAKVVSFDIPEGRQVAAGHVLVRLDDVEYRAATRVARARLRHADERLQRLRSLHGAEVTSEQALEDALVAFDAARGALEEAESRLEHTVIRAPFRGVLGLRQINVGEYLEQGDAVVEITQVDPLELVFAIPQRHAARVAPGQVVLGMAELCGARFEGEVSALDPQVDPATRTLRILATVANDAGQLLPGMSARVRLLVGEIPDALVVPQEAVVRQGTKHLVYVLDSDDRVQPHEVQLGEFFADGVHLRSGVDAGARVVVSGQQKLRAQTLTAPQAYEPPENPNLDLGRFGPLAECEL